MEKIGEALVKLIETGAPLAQWVIVLHYVDSLFSTLLTTGGILLVVLMVTRLIKWGMNRTMEFDEKAQERKDKANDRLK